MIQSGDLEIQRRLERLTRPSRLEAAAYRPRNNPGGRDELTAAADFPLAASTPKGLVYDQQDETAGVWRSYENVPEVWAPLNYLARAIQQIELLVATHESGEPAPVPLVETDGGLAKVAGEQLDRLRSVTGGFDKILFSAAIQFLVPGKGVFVADQNEDGEDQFLILSTSETRHRDGVWERQTGPKEWKPIQGYAKHVWRPHARYSWKPHSSLYSLQGACDEVLLLDRMYRSNARSRIGRGILLAPREADYKPLRPNRTHPERDSLAYALMRILTAAISEEDSSLNVAPAVLELKGDFIEKFKHLTFGESLDKEVAARYDKNLDRIAAGIDLPAGLVKGIESTSHWNAWAIADDSFDQYAAPICELICSALTQVFLWPALDVLGVTERPVIWYDPFRLRSKPPEGDEIDKAFDRGAISWETYRTLRSLDEADAPEDEELDRRSDLGLFKGGAGAGQPAGAAEPVGTTATPVDSRTAAPASAPPPFALNAAATSDRRGGVGAQLVVLDQVLLDTLIREASRIVRPVLTAAVADDWKDEVGGLFRRLVRPVQLAAAQIARRMGFDGDWLEAAQDHGLDSAADLFVEGLGEWVGSTSLDATEEGGAATVEIPTALARAAMSLAGGFRATTELLQPAGGVATGTNTVQALRESGLVATGLVWRYGDSNRPFEGHVQLDGAEFSGWEDEQLAVRPEDAWLGQDFYTPGDHDGCMCWPEPLFAEAE